MQLKKIRFFLGECFRRLVKLLAPRWTVRKAIGRHGDFQISAKFLFSDFETWADGHNAGFDYLIDAAGRDMCVFDVGAHIGITTLPLARAVGPYGRVFAFEPSPLNRAYLDLHLRQNDIRNVTVMDCALTDQVGEVVEFYEMSDVSGMNGLVNNRRGMRAIEVNTVTIDQVVDKFKLRPDLIKIDIEGAELLCLKGARETLRVHQPTIVLSVHPRQMEEMGFSILALESLLNEAGYCFRNLTSGNLAESPLAFGEYAVELRKTGANTP